MLKSLFIQNYALIKSLKISPSESFNTITGETGAGKSIILGAMGLLLGKRADTKALLDPEVKCIVEGIFDIQQYDLKTVFEENDLDYDKECIIRREISPSGKSRAFINDTPTTLDIVSEIGSYLVDVHSQHDTLLLASNAYQLQMIDHYSGTYDSLKAYQNIFNEYKKTVRQLEQIESDASHLQQEKEFNQFQFEELENARLKPDEKEDLEERLKLLEHAEEIKIKIHEAINLLEENEFSVEDGLKNATNSIQQASKFSSSLENLATRLESTWIEIKDISDELNKKAEDIVYDPAETENVRARIDLIYQLLTKHRVTTIEELISVKNDLEDKITRSANVQFDIEDLKIKKEELYKNCLNKAKELSKARGSHYSDFTNKVNELLIRLGIPNADLKIEVNKTELTTVGIDEISLHFSANKGVAPQLLKKAASGGEFSRLMFAIKYILANKTAMPTLIFDEIDTGISGEIALQMVDMMKKMSEHHQLIAISHLPQIAAKGNKHFFVFKDHSSDISESKIKEVNEEERVTIIAEMIGGKDPSESAYRSARELIG
ncbi:DNA repair protein RecN [Marinigracilibium pacificum]|uniref:DNA repair protein RecN n=1 Tax=Marinigracilibium pacificum TaxID=2729599 RepID=A0A848J6U8_9BACT|nr:DNA repair protein RecN [Marinigracilibium pacificum]NMM50174.1 DNA repair protein RecN [Marinigracilibium pacificum]